MSSLNLLTSCIFSLRNTCQAFGGFLGDTMTSLFLEWIRFFLGWLVGLLSSTSLIVLLRAANPDISLLKQKLKKKEKYEILCTNTGEHRSLYKMLLGGTQNQGRCVKKPITIAVLIVIIVKNITSNLNRNWSTDCCTAPQVPDDKDSRGDKSTACSENVGTLFSLVAQSIKLGFTIFHLLRYANTKSWFSLELSLFTSSSIHTR